MEQLARIEARLESLLGLGELVGALRSMAASRVREAQEALAGTRAFCAIVERAIAEIVPACAAPTEQDGISGAVLVVVTSQNGFAGGFNERIVDAALAAQRPEEELVVVGRRGEVALAARALSPDRTHEMTSRAAGVTRLARRISRQMADLSSARIVHAHYISGADYEARVRPVLPLDRPAAIGNGDVPLHHLSPQRLFDALAAEYLFAEIADALMDSLASENAARLRTMNGASHTIDDKLDRLTRDAHVARQDEMTTDMIDVVTGAEAISNGR